METRLTQAQLTKLVGEVERLSQRQQDEFDRAQVQDILRELNLSPDLLDEAMIQLQRKEALAVQQRRQRWLVGGMIASAIVIIAGSTVFIQQQKQSLAHVTAQQSCVALAQNTCDEQTALSRQTSPEVFYNVTLKDAPVGKKLSLACDWVAPGGQVVKQNRYETRPIETAVWMTHCRYKLDAAAPIGNWQVRMTLDDHPLSTINFDVK